MPYRFFLFLSFSIFFSPIFAMDVQDDSKTVANEKEFTACMICQDDEVNLYSLSCHHAHLQCLECIENSIEREASTCPACHQLVEPDWYRSMLSIIELSLERKSELANHLDIIEDKYLKVKTEKQTYKYKLKSIAADANARIQSYALAHYGPDVRPELVIRDDMPFSAAISAHAAITTSAVVTPVTTLGGCSYSLIAGKPLGEACMAGGAGFVIGLAMCPAMYCLCQCVPALFPREMPPHELREINDSDDSSDLDEDSDR